MILFVGNTDHYLEEYAKKIHTNSTLIEKKDLDHLDSIGAGYVSLGDHDLDDFFTILDKASEIYYVPITTWDHEDTKRYTEIYLSYFSHRKPIYNFSSTPIETNMLDLADVRRTDNEQIWSVGCSISHGVGINNDQRWGQLVANDLNKDVSFLTASGSSLEWAADQILRSDIRKNDLVVWGLTGISRFSYYDKEVKHVNQQYYEANPNNDIHYMINSKILVNDYVKYLGLKSIYSVINLSEKLGFRLILMYLPLNIQEHQFFVLEHLSKLKNFVYPQQDFVDIGTDNLHPGPLTHEMYAENILKFYKENYQ